VLKLINSAFYGLPNKVSLKQAVVLLGINTIKNMALSSAIIGQVSKSKIRIKNFNLNRYWEHSLGTGIASKIICKRLHADPQTLDEFFVAGLVHDLGKIILALTLPMLFAKTLQYAQANELSGIEAENHVIGIDHAEVGSMIAQKWSLSQLLVDAIHYHHNPDENHDRLVWVVHLANYYVSKKGYVNTGEFADSQLNEKAFDILGINEKEIEQILEVLPEEIEKAAVFLQS